MEQLNKARGWKISEHYGLTQSQHHVVHQKKNLCEAEWIQEKGLAEVKIQKGKHMHTMGFSNNKKTYLQVEETVYLVDRGCLELYQHGLPMSLQRAFQLLQSFNFPHERYMVYCYLKRLGFVVRRYILTSPIPQESTTHGTITVSTNENFNQIASNNNKLDQKNIIEPLISTIKSSQADVILNRLQIFPTKYTNILDKTIINYTSAYDIHYDVYNPATKFAKNKNILPSFRLCVCRYQDPPPTLLQFQWHTKISSDHVPVKYAVVDSGTVTFFTFQNLNTDIVKDIL